MNEPRLGATFWLGLFGAIFGMFLGVLYLEWPASSSYLFVGIVMIGCSILGLVGGLRIIESNTSIDILNAGLMFIGGVGVLFLPPFGIVPAALFFVGALLILVKKD